MRHRILVVLIVVVVLAACPAFGQTLGAVLTGAQEVPSNSVAGFGNATVTFDATRTHIDVTITAADLVDINNFHIHEQGPGVIGPVVVNLIGLGGNFVNGRMTGTFAIAADVAARMLQNPNNFYVNVHTVQLPTGAIRGQLAYVTGGPITYAAELRPGNEVPAVASSAFGSAFVTLDPINSTIAWAVDTSGIASASMSHIHRGAAGANGPVIINFATSPAQIAGGETRGSAAISTVQAGAFLASDLTALSTPATAGAYYVNVHSAAAPGGEIRGQLVPAFEYDAAVAGHVTNAAGTTFVTDMRVFNPSYTTPAAALLEYFPAGTSANASATNSMAVNIPARGTAALDDVAGDGKLSASGSVGAVRVTSATQLAVTSRVYADLRASGKGTLGQFVPAAPRTSALRRGVLTQLSNHSDPTSGYRTNVGFFNPSTSPATLRLELRDAFGTLLRQTTLTLQPLTQQQNAIGTYFAGLDLSDAANLTLSFDASTAVFAYAAVNDNISADSIFVAAQPDVGVAAN